MKVEAKYTLTLNLIEMRLLRETANAAIPWIQSMRTKLEQDPEAEIPGYIMESQLQTLVEKGVPFLCDLYSILDA